MLPEKIYRWYEEQNKGLGSEFIRIIDTNLAQIQRNPSAYPLIFKKVRRKIIKRFPYGLFDVVAQEQITILACFHLKQNILQNEPRFKS